MAPPFRHRGLSIFQLFCTCSQLLASCRIVVVVAMLNKLSRAQLCYKQTHRPKTQKRPRAVLRKLSMILLTNGHCVAPIVEKYVGVDTVLYLKNYINKIIYFNS